MNSKGDIDSPPTAGSLPEDELIDLEEQEQEVNGEEDNGDNGEDRAERRRQRREKRRWRPEDYRLVRRVLHYARPFRGQILVALLVGLLAGFLTALNLALLIPVLDVMLADKHTYDQNVARLIENRDRHRDRLDEERATANPVRQLELWWRVKRTEMRVDWTEWVIKHREKVIYWMAGILIIAQIIKSLLEYWSKHRLQRCFFLALVRLKTHLYERCLRMDMGEFDKRQSADLIARLNNDVRQVRLVFTTTVGEAVLAPFSVIFLLILLILLNPIMTLFVAIGLPFIIMPIVYVGKMLRTLGKKDEEEDAKILGFTQETLQGLLVVKSYGSERREFKRFKNLNREMARRQIRREKYRLLSEPFVEITASIAMAIVLVVGAYMVLDADDMSAAAFLTYLAALTRFYPPIKKVTGAFVKLQKSLASAERIFEVIDSPSQVVERPDAHELGPFKESIEFRNVGFRYTPEKPAVLTDFSMVIPHGRKVAFVGKTGAGKSTLARLVPRLYDVNEGALLVDGVDVREAKIRSLRRQIASVTQDVILFNGSVRDNIAYSRPDATMEEVEDAARAANATEFIERMPFGFETEVGERGGQLSGGQKQRLSIARALLANAPILILDEATSALDNESEALVQQAIERLMTNRTVIIIAHRLSTVRKADEIVVLANGGIAERGSHEALLARRGAYYRMITDADLEE